MINWGNFKEDRNLKFRDRILRLQKCFLRIIHGAHRLTHADPLFAQASALKIDELFMQSVRCFALKLKKNKLPARMASLASNVNHSHQTRGSKVNLAVNSSDHRSLRYITPNHWNPLPITLKNSPTISTFKLNSKKDLLKPYSALVCTIRDCRSCQYSLPSKADPT